MAGPAEEMFFFEGPGGRKLLGFLHRAAGPRRDSGVVYCHPFAEERNQSHGVATKAARVLAARGISVLRFDFSGCGDSEGDLEEASAESWISEIGCAAGVLRERAGISRPGVWGLRAGANLAGCYAAGREDVAFGVFWQPQPDLKVSISQFLRQKLSTGMVAGSGEGLSVKGLVKQLEEGGTVEVMGYPVTRRLYESFASRTAALSASEFPFPALLAAVTEAEAPPEGLRRMAEGLRSAHGPAHFIHAREAPFWDRYWRWDAPSLALQTADWMASLT